MLVVGRTAKNAADAYRLNVEEQMLNLIDNRRVAGRFATLDALVGRQDHIGRVLVVEDRLRVAQIGGKFLAKLAIPGLDFPLAAPPGVALDSVGDMDGFGRLLID